MHSHIHIIPNMGTQRSVVVRIESVDMSVPPWVVASGAGTLLWLLH